jgi:hypothetical protein
LGHNANANRIVERYSGTQSLGAPPEVLRWQVELHELGRDIKAELDTKMIAVRTLLRQYDLAAQRLNELIRIADQVDPSVARQPSETKCLPAIKQLRLSGWNDRQIAEALQLPVESVMKTGLERHESRS